MESCSGFRDRSCSAKHGECKTEGETVRVAVTGASGHVGANLVRALLARGDEVRVLLRADDRAVRGLELERIPGDLLDPAALAVCLLGDLESTIAREQLASPSVIVVGDVLQGLLAAGVDASELPSQHRVA